MKSHESRVMHSRAVRPLLCYDHRDSSIRFDSSVEELGIESVRSWSTDDQMGEKLNIQMWGYLPAASVQRTPFLQPTPVPPSSLEEGWRSVCSGGCGFGLAISESGKLNTWGSTNDLGQCYMITGKEQERPEPYLFNRDANFVQAAAGWAHCVAVTDKGEVFTWGWSECVPNANTATSDGQGAPCGASSEVVEDTSAQTLRPTINEHSDCADSTPTVSLDAAGRSAPSSGQERSRNGTLSSSNKLRHSSFRPANNKSCERKSSALEDNPKRRKVVVPNEDTSDENLMAPPCLVTLDPGVIITSVAAGGRHTLALSDAGKVWGWGYGGEGQLGLGSRMRTVSSPQPIPHLEGPSTGNGSSKSRNSSGVVNFPGEPSEVLGTRVVGLACGGRHSAVLTDSGAVLSFGWGLYGQCGQGTTDDELSPAYISALGGVKITGVAAGLWHTVFTSETGDVYACGGNQFGQLGTGGDQAEMLPTLVDAPVLENEKCVYVSCGARHSAVMTESGKIFCWGWNKYGQLGIGDTVDRDIPAEVTLKDCSAKSMACGWWHTLALLSEKTAVVDLVNFMTNTNRYRQGTNTRAYSSTRYRS
ncbi:hypothetical protein R1flu_011392 [Riccia fluitans]|uniref:RCC1-like domain-containing protein n=1 Tax=Riccia fluitans TaxID=41844 RepID=A0ABD1Z8H8_9MARC